MSSFYCVTIRFKSMAENTRHGSPINQAAEIAQVPMGTIYDWSSRGHFNDFKSRRGRRVRLINRDAFVRFLIGPQ